MKRPEPGNTKPRIVDVRPKVMVGVPLQQPQVDFRLAALLVNMASEQRVRMVTSFAIHQSPGHAINTLAKQAVDMGVDFLLAVSPETLPTKEPFGRCFSDLDVVGFPSPMIKATDDENGYTIHYNTFHDVDDKLVPMAAYDGGLGRVDVIGFGCTLYAARVLRVVKPLFLREFDEDGIATGDPGVSFCRRAREAGFKIWADYSRPCTNLQTIDVGMLIAGEQPTDKVVAKKGGQIELP